MKVKAEFHMSTAQNLERRGYKVLFVQFNNRRGFLYGQPTLLENLPKVFPITVEEVHKVPISRQLIDLHIGKVPQQDRKENRTCYIQVLEHKPNGAYPAWEIIRG